MPETRAWSGAAHDAATGMFDRAHQSTKSFSDYTSAIGDALDNAAEIIGSTRKALLDKADEIDAGPLNVSEGWVVLIDPGAQTAGQIDELMKLVVSEQTAINDLLVAVGDADDSTADSLMAAAKPFGFTPPATAGLPGMMPTNAPRPPDDVPSPRHPAGLLQQATIRGEEMATTVRETQSGYNKDGHFEKTLIMQDGSKMRITEYEPDHDRGVPDMVEEEHFDANGELISWTTSTRTLGGYEKTIMNWADGTQYVVDRTPEGVATGHINLPGNRQVVIPPNSPLLTTVPDRVGDVLTGLEAHIADGGRIPMLSMDNVEKIGAGAKYGGAALGTMSAMYDFLRASTPADKCVSVFAGTFGLTGNALGGAGGAALGAPIPFPGTTAGLAIIGSVAVGELMKEAGTKVGEVLCGN
ncbi:hypothetical protein P9A17_02160 [Mycobacterium sp. 236(2023)]|nr:hypothetical protein [Mycobacterium sp. 236(2023)]MDG4663391.1 hypothetical protein [Mycobacterium sp. 236(2023)]